MRADVHDLVQMWQTLGDEAQVNYLASMCEGTLTEDIPDTEDVQHRTDYYIDGAKMCRSGFCAILGTKPQTLMKRMQRCLDLRKKLPGESGEGTRPGSPRAPRGGVAGVVRGLPGRGRGRMRALWGRRAVETAHWLPAPAPGGGVSAPGLWGAGGRREHACCKPCLFAASISGRACTSLVVDEL